jgi:uncharacterized protein (TIGR02594 family)
MKLPTDLPSAYGWLAAVGTLPRTIQCALDLYGTREVVGRGSNATIIGWRDELNAAAPAGKPLVSGFSDDDIPWCGLFAAIVTYRRVKRIEEVVKNPLWARNWTKYGVRAAKPGLGDILVFARGSGGHVGFYVAEDKTTYHVLGGNQSNKVCITRISKDRFLAARRPVYKSVPSSVKPYEVLTGGALSTNEA